MHVVRQWLILLLILGSGCSKEGVTEGSAASATTPASDQPFVETTHQVVLETTNDNLAKAYEAGLAACERVSADEETTCYTLNSSFAEGDWPKASFQMRVTPRSIQTIVDATSASATILRRSTESQDLAKPIMDQSEKIAMLDQYLVDLVELRGQATNDVDAMIKLAKEISKTQSTLDSVRSTHAHLLMRVELDRLEVQISSDADHSFWTPIGHAFSDFGEDLSYSLAEFITGVTYVLPWLIFFMLVLFSGRWIWKR